MKLRPTLAALALTAITIQAATMDGPQTSVVDYGPPSAWTNVNFIPVLDVSEYEIDTEDGEYPDGVLDDDQWEEDVDETGPALRDEDAEALNQFQSYYDIDEIID